MSPNLFPSSRAPQVVGSLFTRLMLFPLALRPVLRFLHTVALPSVLFPVLPAAHRTARLPRFRASHFPYRFCFRLPDLPLRPVPLSNRLLPSADFRFLPSPSASFRRFPFPSSSFRFLPPTSVSFRRLLVFRSSFSRSFPRWSFLHRQAAYLRSLPGACAPFASFGSSIHSPTTRPVAGSLSRSLRLPSRPQMITFPSTLASVLRDAFWHSAISCRPPFEIPLLKGISRIFKLPHQESRALSVPRSP